MSTNIIEHIRSVHSEIDGDKKNIIDEILTPETKHKKQIIQAHKIKAKADRIHYNQKKLITLYKDETGALAECKKRIRVKNNLGIFYSRLNDLLMQKKSITENKRKAETIVEPLKLALNFSGEEFYGKYVEMNALYREFLNLKGVPSMYLNGIKKIDYKLYLEVFDHFHHTPQSSKKSKKYAQYCQKVRDYLVNFYSQRYPLHPIQTILCEIEDDFHEKWETGNIPGWQKEWPSDILQKYPSKSSLSLKERKLLRNNEVAEKNSEIKTRFCEACGKDFKETVYLSHTKGKKHLKNIINNQLNKNKKKFQKKDTACLEYTIKVFKTLLNEVFDETCYYIEKKLTRSYAEIQKELQLREKEEEEDEELLGEEAEKRDQSLWSGGVYNPKKVPLGWDGRPIPYWLYKFHGLNIGYKCEICGGTKYYGPRAFQQHFKEWKHANGMKALGLPNTKHFDYITKIDEAETLYSKLKEKKLIELFNPELEEEFEDNEGNVYGKQTYDALKRQRVI